MEASTRQNPTVAPLSVPAVQAPGLRLVHGRTMREALLRARQELGDKAVVVDQRTVAGKVTLAVSTTVPRSTDALRTMREEAERLLQAPPEPVAAPEAAPQPPRRSPLADVERRLREHGATKKLREHVLEGVVAREKEGGHPLDVAAEEVGKLFDYATLEPARGETALLALVGQSGVGKSTTLAKLGLRLVRAGRSVVLATLDADRLGAAAQIREFGQKLRVPAIALRDTANLAAELARAPGRVDVVLIDGTGDETADVEALRRLSQQCDEAGARTRLASLVVLPATASAAALEATTSAAAPLEPVGAVVTKLDEADEPLPALEHARSHGLGLAFLTNGPDLGPHFSRASAERVADVALLGRIG
ncbi:MAG: AAA family ATPase [Planctomycetota bacterium]